MARNRQSDYSGSNFPTITPVKPLSQVIRLTVVLTQAEYNALSVKDDSVLYLIKA